MQTTEINITDKTNTGINAQVTRTCSSWRIRIISDKENGETKTPAYKTYLNLNVPSEHFLQTNTDLSRSYNKYDSLSLKIFGILDLFSIDDSLKTVIYNDFIRGLKVSSSKKITVEKTPEDSLLLKAVSSSHDYYLEVFFDSEEENGYEAYLNVYDNSNLLSFSTGNLITLFNSLS